jgi:hypothetical protein
VLWCLKVIELWPGSHCGLYREYSSVVEYVEDDEVGEMDGRLRPSRSMRDRDESRKCGTRGLSIRRRLKIVIWIAHNIEEDKRLYKSRWRSVDFVRWS